MGLKRGLKVPDSKLRWAADGLMYGFMKVMQLCVLILQAQSIKMEPCVATITFTV